MNTVSILGIKYDIIRTDKMQDQLLIEENGYVDYTCKKIVVDNSTENSNLKFPEKYYENVLRHEIVHAFLYESGLHDQSWAINEEIVDWIALQFPKMQEALSEASK